MGEKGEKEGKENKMGEKKEKRTLEKPSMDSETYRALDYVCIWKFVSPFTRETKSAARSAATPSGR